MIPYIHRNKQIVINSIIISINPNKSLDKIGSYQISINI